MCVCACVACLGFVDLIKHKNEAETKERKKNIEELEIGFQSNVGNSESKPSNRNWQIASMEQRQEEKAINVK